MHQQFIKLDSRLHTIEQARGHGDAIITDIQTRLDRKDIVDNLQAETKCVMISAVKSFFNSKMEENNSSSTPTIINEVSNNMFATPSAPQPSLLPCPSTLGQLPTSPPAVQRAQADCHPLLSAT